MAVHIRSQPLKLIRDPRSLPLRQPPVLDALMMAIPMSKLADANTLFNVGQRMAASFAIALLITLLEQRQRVHLADGDSIQGAMMAAWLNVIVALVALSVAAVVVALLFRPGTTAARPPRSLRVRQGSLTRTGSS